MANLVPQRRAALAFFALTLISYVYFYQGGGPNQFSRFGLTAALAIHGRVDIDDYHELTFDKAVKGGHFYCDKAPGLSLLAVPGLALCRPLIERATRPGSWGWVNLSLYVMTVLAVSLPVAVAMASFYRRARVESGPRPAFWVATALALGSPLAVYASLFYSHALAAALLWLAFDLVTADRAQRPLSPGRTAAAGLLAGWAVLSEFPTVLIVGLLFLYLCLARPGGRRRAIGFVLGGLPTLAVLVAYNVAAFGRPLASGYEHHYVPAFREAMSRGIMGVTGPSWEAFLGMLFGSYRGLVWFWPFTICVLGAGPLLAVRKEWHGPAVLAAGIVMVYLVFGCSYFLWTGGASYGPRHLVPCLPFGAYLVVRAHGSALRWLVPPTAVASVGLALASTATLAEFPEAEPDFRVEQLLVLGRSDVAFPANLPWAALFRCFPPEESPGPAERLNPVYRIGWPRFLRGDLSVKYIGREGRIGWSRAPFPADHPQFYDACNLGEMLGLRGLASLLPLGVVWSGLGGYLWRRERALPPDATAAPGPG